MTSAGEVLDRCGEIARISARAGSVQRFHLTPEHRAANERVAGWMARAGLDTRVDAAGNLLGRREGPRRGLPALVLGSHLDTVPDAGWYDGVLGVVMAVAVAERLAGETLPFALEVYGFSDEEGARFGTALLGSQAVAGRWDPRWWDRCDRDGVTLRQAFVDVGLDPCRVGEAARDPAELVGYLEAHIEQGTALETADRSLGLVTTIAGARRLTVSVLGEARHAGTTPYPDRRDALVGASLGIAAIERLARATGPEGGVATVGRIEVSPGAVNVIPGRADFSLDLRAATDEERDRLWDRIDAELRAICHDHGLGLEVVEDHRAAATVCAPWLQRAIATGIAATDDPGGDAPMRLWSRAGHDAMAIAGVTDVGMLFVRCREGISHQAAEGVRELDVARGIDAFEATVREVARVV